MTATMPPSSDVRDCHLYRFWVRHPVTGERVLGYVGETVRQPLQRLIEHLYDQPWADTIIAWEVDDVVYAGKRAVLEAETFAIRTELPLYNVRINESNPDRIPPPLAIRQRRARDAARNGVRWVHPDDRGDRPQERIVPVRRGGLPQWVTPFGIKVGLWSVTWGSLTLLGFGELERLSLWPGRVNLGVAAGIASALLVWALLRGSPTARRWKRQLRRWRRTLGV